jgi:hypothetical protein
LLHGFLLRIAILCVWRNSGCCLTNGMQTKENKSHQLASWLLIANWYFVWSTPWNKKLWLGQSCLLCNVPNSQEHMLQIVCIGLHAFINWNKQSSMRMLLHKSKGFARFVVESIWCRANDAKFLVPVVQHGKPPQQRQTEHTQTHKTHTPTKTKTMLCHSFLGSSTKISSDSERPWLLQGQRGDIPRLTGNQID